MATRLARTPEQWIGGEFNFDDWLSDCLLTGHIEKVDTDPEIVGWFARTLVDPAPSYGYTAHRFQRLHATD